jgi:dihydrofolate synthase/folylpolyglutamate synthase
VNYPDSVQFLYALGNEISTAKLGLDRIRTVLDSLGRPQDRLRFVHVAGTNGKGSVCAMIESALRAAGSVTGLFTSPHLAEPTERIRIGGLPVSAARFAQAFDRVHRAVETLLESGSIDLHTTYFETVTAMALLLFAEERVDKVVLETGLGGRLDATNVVTPDVTVITPVDFDHEAFLGKSLESIAAEKAGILKPGVPAVFSRQRPEAAAVLARRAAELAIPVDKLEGWAVRDLDIDATGSRFHLSGSRQLQITCPLAGAHQVENAATAAIALARLGLPDRAIETGIAAAHWPGRLERVSLHPEIILDGAHNPAGARALAAHIERFYSTRRVRLVFGAMRDKAISEISGILFPLAAEVVATAPAQARALSPDAFLRVAAHPHLRIARTLPEAMAMATDGPANPNDVVFVTGSLFLVAEARAVLGGQP